MAGISSQLGNRYCYYVGAFLKTNKFHYGEGKEIILKNHDIIADSIKIPAETSSFNQRLSLDLLASTSESEYFGECKWTGNPRKISSTSNEFIDALLEFMGLEKYKQNITWKEVEYIFITAHLVEKLCEEIEKLKISTSSDIEKYLKTVKKKAHKKWTKINTNKITEKLLRKSLNRILILRIGSDRLDESYKTPEFQRELRKIQNKNLSRDVSLPFPTIIKNKNIVLMYGEDEDDNYYEELTLGYVFKISKKVLNDIGTFLKKNKPPKTVIVLDESELCFLSSFIINKNAKISNFLLKQLLIEVINKIFMSEYHYQTIVVIFNPDIRIVYVINSKWLLNIASKHVSMSNMYILKDISDIINNNISNSLIELSIIEAKRQKGIIIDRELFEG